MQKHLKMLCIIIAAGALVTSTITAVMPITESKAQQAGIDLAKKRAKILVDEAKERQKQVEKGQIDTTNDIEKRINDLRDKPKEVIKSDPVSDGLKKLFGYNPSPSKEPEQPQPQQPCPKVGEKRDPQGKCVLVLP